ncbi:MAG: hypothetical protein HWE20_04170 [Gammaproteobacteria bacterium]|nr:hypothetical protein [Gammaproteobacteria bacterium]
MKTEALSLPTTLFNPASSKHASSTAAELFASVGQSMGTKEVQDKAIQNVVANAESPERGQSKGKANRAEAYAYWTQNVRGD